MNGLKGFTLIELLIMIAMISIITATLFVDHSANTSYFSLERSVQGIGQDFRKAQSMSLSGIRDYPDINGYGLYFNSGININNAYTIYANTNDDPFYNAGDRVVEIIQLPENVVIEEIKINTATVNFISASFFPPGPITFIDNNSSGFDATIVLKITDREEVRKAIKINNSGAFEIYNP